MRPLADRLRSHAPSRVVASLEPKAQETGRLLASRLGVPWSVRAGLHEHDRCDVPFLGREQFLDSVAAFFRTPDQLVFGSETARDALARFSCAVDAVLSRYPDGSVAIVAHGTVISLYVADACGVEPYALWRELGLPSFVAVSLPDARLLDVVGSV